MPPTDSDEATHQLRPVGFWWSERELWWPHPKDAIVPDWPREERAAVIDYLLRPEDVQQYLGLSRCRLCDRLVGSRTFTDGTWAWPEGLVHYVDCHGVRPPDEFVHWILACSEAASKRLACAYSRERGVGPVPSRERLQPHFETHHVAVHPVKQALRLAEEEAARFEEREWLAAAPVCLRSWIVGSTSNEFATVRRARELLLAEHRGDAQAAMTALLKWYGTGTGSWRGRLGQALVAGIIDDFPRSEVIAALESPLATERGLEGSARYVAQWAYGRASGAACQWLPARLHARLRAAATATGDEDNTVAVDGAFGQDRCHRRRHHPDDLRE